jgi:GH18 family chitinase
MRIRLATSVWLVLCFGAMLVSATADDRADVKNPSDTLPFRVVGYLPDYRLATFDESAARLVTDLVVFSAEVDASGRLDTKRLPSEQLRRLKQIKQRTRVGLTLCVGGWDRSRGFAAMTASSESRKRFIHECTRFCLDQRLDAIDFDWEHPANEAEQQNYARLLTETKAAIQEHGLAVSVTMAAWQQLAPAVFQAVDAVHVMAYDHEGRHSTLDGAKRDIELLLDRGVPPNKLLLGLPFYGRGITSADRTLTYAEILRKHSPAPDVDEVDGLFFNGPQTIDRKVAFAKGSRLGGVMIWELGQDAAGEKSLLRRLSQPSGDSRR